MATTERGIYYTTGANDADIADLNVITKRIADSVEAALDQWDAEHPHGVVRTDGGGVTIDIPVAPAGKRWCVTTGVENTAGGNPTIVQVTVLDVVPYFYATAYQWAGAWMAVPAEISWHASLVPAEG